MKNGDCYLLRLLSRSMSSSRLISTSWMILRSRPGLMVSPACKGTTVLRPSGCRKKAWLPFCRMTKVGSLKSFCDLFAAQRG
jgi:hypothetical protein